MHKPAHSGITPEAKALEKNKDVYQTVQKMWDELFVASAQQTQAETEQKKTPSQKETDGKAQKKGKKAVSENVTKFLQFSMRDNPPSLLPNVSQEDIDFYVESAYSKNNKQDYKKYATVSDRLAFDVEEKIPDIRMFTHALRDNDIRHIRNSHGEQTGEKYPVSIEDQKLIPCLYYTAAPTRRHLGDILSPLLQLSDNILPCLLRSNLLFQEAASPQDVLFRDNLSSIAVHLTACLPCLT